MGGLDYFSQLLQAVNGLLIVIEPEFIRIGLSIFTGVALISIVLAGVKFMLTGGGTLQDRVYDFAKTMLGLSIGYAMLAFYESPIPGVGISFSNLITDGFAHLASILDAGAVRSVYIHLDAMFNRFVAPGYMQIAAALIYLVLVVALVFAKALTIAVIARGMIGSAICGLLGPIFVSTFCIGPIRFFFWGWLKTFVTYNLYPVISYAMLMVFERFLFNVMTRIPPGVTSDLYLLYGLMVVGVAFIFSYVILSIPSLAASLVSGHAHDLSGRFLR